MGIFGTSASTTADVNLVAQLVIIVALAVGWVYGRDKKKIRRHGQLMVAAVIVHGAAIALVMVPSLILGFGAITSDPLGPGSIISVAHAIIGTIPWIYGVYLSCVWKLRPVTVECFKRKNLMKPILYTWLAAAILGVGFYVYYYLI